MNGTERSTSNNSTDFTRNVKSVWDRNCHLNVIEKEEYHLLVNGTRVREGERGKGKTIKKNDIIHGVPDIRCKLSLIVLLRSNHL